MKNKMKILIGFLSLLLIASIALNVLLVQDNNEIQVQIEKRDNLIKAKQANDSLLSAQTTTNEKIIEKYIDDCGILINGRKVTTDQLLLYIKDQIKESEQLKKELDLLERELYLNADSLKIYKTFNELTKRNLNVSFKVTEKDMKRTISIMLPLDSSSAYKDSLTAYKEMTRLIEKDYGIKYLIEYKNNQFVLNNQFSKADSAKMIFEYYKDKLHKNKSGEWVIELPWKMKFEKKNKK
jgi:hypothetical protein